MIILRHNWRAFALSRLLSVPHVAARGGEWRTNDQRRTTDAGTRHPRCCRRWDIAPRELGGRCSHVAPPLPRLKEVIDFY